MPEPAVTLPMLEAFIAEPRKRLAFPPAFEKIYEQQMEGYRRKVMTRGVLPAIVIYNVFLIADLLLLPETLLLAAVLHFAIVTPIILAAAFSYTRTKRHWLRELLAAVIPFMMIAQIMFVYARNEGVAADQYQYLAIMIVIYMNVNLRFGFRLAVASTLLLMVSYLAVLLPGHSPFEVKFTGSGLMASAAYLSLMANRRMEQDVRFSFLTRLHDQLHRESAEDVARRDALTGLANRRLLDEVVHTIWSAEQKHTPVAVIMADIDYFKPFNDRYGHGAGDACLKRIAGAIASELRHEGDLAVRLGGEEFLLLLRSADMSEAVRVAERVRRQIESIAIPHAEFGPRGVVTTSLGVASGPVSAHSFTELLAGADAALYAAKRNGRNQVWPPFIARDNPVARLRPDSSVNALTPKPSSSVRIVS